jgi:hypothetical protein
MAESAGEDVGAPFLTGRREMVLAGRSGTLDKVVGMSPIFNWRALNASLSGRGTRSNVSLSFFVTAMQHPPPQHFSTNFVPASPIILWISAAFCEISFVDARRLRTGSSGSSDEDEE